MQIIILIKKDAAKPTCFVSFTAYMAFSVRDYHMIINIIFFTICKK